MKTEKLPQKSIGDSLKELRSKWTPEQRASVDEFKANIGKAIVENLNRNVREDYLTK